MNALDNRRHFLPHGPSTAADLVSTDRDTGSPLRGRAGSVAASAPRSFPAVGVSPLKLVLLASALACEAYRPLMIGWEPEAFKCVADRLQLALGSAVGLVRVEVDHTGYDFVRNLAAIGAGGTVVMSNPERLVHLQQGQDVSVTALRSTFSRLDLPVRSLDFPVNFANLAFDPGLDLLVMATPAPLEPACSWIHPTLGCDKQIEQLAEAFGSPANVLRFEPSRSVPHPGLPAGQACYDLDAYFSLFRNRRDEPVTMIHWPCVLKEPSSAAARKSGSVGRAKLKARLEALGVTVVEVSRDDFLRRACNAVSPEPGHLVFSEPVSPGLQDTLRRLQVSTTPLEDFLPGREYGIHCLTLELPPAVTATCEGSSAAR